MTISPQAKDQAQRLGIAAIAKRAQEALEAPKKPYNPQDLSVYFGSLRLQHGPCDIRLKDNVVYLFKGEVLAHVYALPRPLINKMAKLSNMKGPLSKRARA